ncbi:MAG: hypothetical protein E7300_03720 [Lachnospiraceae bacterium]|nr:hypothetical protein [Lachnospiraceae bacterium]
MIQATDLNGDVAARFDAADLQAVAQKVDENVSDVESLNSKADSLAERLGGEESVVGFEVVDGEGVYITYKDGDNVVRNKLGSGSYRLVLNASVEGHGETASGNVHISRYGSGSRSYELRNGTLIDNNDFSRTNNGKDPYHEFYVNVTSLSLSLEEIN